jgi:hypothetical protein
MQNNTKKYIKDSFDYLEIQLNTIEAEVRDVIKIRRKLQKLLKKMPENC